MAGSGSQDDDDALLEDVLGFTKKALRSASEANRGLTATPQMTGFFCRPAIAMDAPSAEL